jgi:hypothetical protein
VNWHVEKAKKRFGVTTRIQAVMAAVRLGVLPSQQASRGGDFSP